MEIYLENKWFFRAHVMSNVTFHGTLNSDHTVIVGDIVEGIVQMMIQVWNFAKRFITVSHDIEKQTADHKKKFVFPRWSPEILKTWSLLTCQKFELIKTWYKIILEFKF